MLPLREPDSSAKLVVTRVNIPADMEPDNFFRVD